MDVHLRPMAKATPFDARGAGERLRALREARGWTQEDLARAAEVTTQTVYRLEAGKSSNPKLETLRAIADALGVSVTAFAGRDSPSGQFPAAKAVAVEAFLARHADAVTPDQAAALRSIDWGDLEPSEEAIRYLWLELRAKVS